MPRKKIFFDCDFLNPLRAKVEMESKTGAELIHNPQSNSLCELIFDQTVPCITVIWKNYVTSAQIRFIHEYMILMFHKHAVGKLLGDDTALPMVHSEDQEWIARDWMPRAAAAGFKAGAAKISKEYFGRLSTASIRTMAPNEITIKFFENIEDARSWLRTA